MFNVQFSGSCESVLLGRTFSLWAGRDSAATEWRYIQPPSKFFYQAAAFSDASVVLLKLDCPV